MQPSNGKISIEQRIIELFSNLDFSSWFDMWHTHTDWEGESQNNWGIRQEFLSEMFILFEKANEEMVKLNRDYQSFCIIDMEDASQDAMYIHTENPNRENYPMTFDVSDESSEFEFPFTEFIEAQGYDWKKLEEGNFILVYKLGYGIRPFK